MWAHFLANKSSCCLESCADAGLLLFFFSVRLFRRLFLGSKKRLIGSRLNQSGVVAQSLLDEDSANILNWRMGLGNGRLSTSHVLSPDSLRMTSWLWERCRFSVLCIKSYAPWPQKMSHKLCGQLLTSVRILYNIPDWHHLIKNENSIESPRISLHL